MFDRRTDGTFNGIRATQGEQMSAGVGPLDSPISAQQKVDFWRQQKTAGLPRLTLADAPALLGQLAGGFFLFVMCMVILIQAFSKHPLDIFFRPIKSYAEKQIANSYIEKFSNYSKPETWPKGSFDAGVPYKNKSLAEIVAIRDSIVNAPFGKPSGRLTDHQYEAMGAVVWENMAAAGPNAYEVARSSGRLASAQSLALGFLTIRCRQNIEAACLDRAQAKAALLLSTYRTIYPTNTSHSENAAKSLPTDGPLANSPAVNKLREEILSTGPSAFWQWVWNHASPYTD